MSNKLSRNEIRKIRYHLLRDAGYSAKEASQLRGRSLDVSTIKLDDNNNIVKKNNYKKRLKYTKTNYKINNYTMDALKVKNDSVYTNWGFITHGNKHKDETAQIVSMIQKDLKATNNQAYFLLYTMYQEGISYEEAKKRLVGSEEWEKYRKGGRLRK